MLRMCSTLLKNWYKNILKRFLMRNAWNIHHFLGRDRCSPMIKRWNVRKQKLVSTQIPFYVLVGWNKHREPQYKDGKDKLKTSGSIPRTKMQMDSTEKQLNSSGYFPWISDIFHSQGDPDGLGGENFKVRIVFMSMYNDLLWKADDENCISNAEKVKELREEILTRTLDICVSRVGKR